MLIAKLYVPGMTITNNFLSCFHGNEINPEINPPQEGSTMEVFMLRTTTLEQELYISSVAVSENTIGEYSLNAES